jgi:hypothetical protein
VPENVPLTDTYSPFHEGDPSILDATRNTQYDTTTTARNGKIAHLPRDLRDQINQHLASGQSAISIARELNQLPEVKTMLATHFEGRPISQQNLSEWKQGGYRDWLAQQELLHQETELTADAHDLAQTANGLSDSLFGMILLDYAHALKNRNTETPKQFEKRRRKLSAWSQDVIRLRRCDLQGRRVEVQEAHLECTREKTREEVFQKFVEWAENPEIRRVFFLLPQARQAELRARFKMPPTPEDEALLKEVESLKNEDLQTEIQTPLTEKSEPEAQSATVPVAPVEVSPSDDSPVSPITPISSSSEKLSATPHNLCPQGTSENSPAFQRWENNPIKKTSPAGTTENTPYTFAPIAHPTSSPAGCGTLAGDNIPGEPSPLTSHPGGVPENIPSSIPPASEAVAIHLPVKNPVPIASPSPGGDLSRLGSGERNLACESGTKVAPQPSERARASQRQGEVRVSPIPSATKTVTPPIPTSEYDKAILAGKSHVEALYAQFTPTPEEKERRRLAHAAIAAQTPTPISHVPASQLYGPCPPPYNWRGQGNFNTSQVHCT